MKSAIKQICYKLLRMIVIIPVWLLFSLFLVMSGKAGIKNVQEYLDFEHVNLCYIDNIEQKIMVKYNYLNSLSLFIVNLDDKTTGKIELRLKDKKGKEIFHRAYSAREIEAGRYQEFPIHKFVEPGKEYVLLLDYVGEVPEYGAPKIYIAPKNRNLKDTGECLYNGELMEGNIAICYSYYQIPYYFWGIIMVVFLILLLVFVF